MPRVLLIAPYFPPRQRVGALRPYRFATRLIAHGWESKVICLATPGANLEPHAASRLAQLERWEVRSPLDRTRRRADSDLEQAHRPTSIAAGRPRGWLDRLADKVDAAFPVDTWAPLLMWAAPGLVRQARVFKPDLIWATADPWSSLGLAQYLAKRLQVPWIADLRDPWTLCPVRSGQRTSWARAWDRFFERRFLKSATAIGFTSRLTLERYAQAYPEHAERMFNEPNSFDASPPTWYGDELRLAPTTRPLEVTFFGRFRASAPPTLLIDALAQIKAQDPQLGLRIRVRSVGGLQGEDARRAERLGVANQFESMGAVPNSEATRTLAKADLLVLTTAPVRPEMIAAKLWDYLPAQRPVLALSDNPEIGEVLTRTGLGRLISVSTHDAVSQVSAALKEAANNLHNGQPLLAEFAPNPEALRGYSADASTARLVAQFQRALTRQGPPKFDTDHGAATSKAVDSRV